MGDTPPSTEGRIEGDYELPPSGRLPVPGPGGVEITGVLRSRGSGTVEGSVRCRGVRVSDGTLQVRGALTVADQVDVRHGKLEVEGDLSAERISGDRSVSVGGNLTCRDVDVDGTLEVRGNSSGDRVEVGGTATFRGSVEVRDLQVGGRVVLAGGKVPGRLSVGGALESTGPIVFGTLEAGGLATLRGNAQGESLDVGGMIDCEGDLTLTRRGDVGGRIRVRGVLRSARLDVGGFLSAAALESDDLDVGGIVDVHGAITGRRIDVGGRLSAERIVLTEQLEVGEELRTRSGTKADVVRIKDRTRVVGPLVGRDVTIGTRSTVEDVWATRLRVEERARTNNLYVESVDLEDRAEVGGDLQFTRSVRVDGQEYSAGTGPPNASDWAERLRRIRLYRPPQLVSQLPPAPL